MSESTYDSNDILFYGILYQAAVDKIKRCYNYYYLFSKVSDISCLLILGFRLFQIPCNRSMQLNCITADNQSSINKNMGDLEKDGLLFLESNNSNSELTVQLSFIMIELLYSRLVFNKVLPGNALLTNNNAMNWRENEQSDLSMILLKLKAFNAIQSYNTTNIPLSQLFPIHSAKQNELTVTIPENFQIDQLPHQVTKLNWNDFKTSLEHKRQIIQSFLNASGAAFADSFIMTNPVILIQSKQSKNAKDKILSNMINDSIVSSDHLVSNTSNTSYNEIAIEHDKCRIKENHLFIFVTDCFYNGSAADDEIIISSNCHDKFYGEILTKRKLFMHTSLNQ